MLLGCEPQLSPISGSTVLRRSQMAYDDGIIPLWATNSRTASVIDRAPWARIDAMPWRQYLEPAPDTEYGQLRRTSMTAPLLYLNGEAWWWYSAVGLVATCGNPEAAAIRKQARALWPRR